MNQILQAALLLALVGTVCCRSKRPPGIRPAGGWSLEEEKPDDSIREIVLRLQDEIEEKLSPDLFDKFEALSYKDAQASGRFLLIKVKATKKDKTKIYLHLYVYDKYWGKDKSLKLIEMRTTCSSSEPLEPFRDLVHK